MEKFSRHTGVPVPLRRSNVDTDQIIPAAYLKRIERTGFEDGLFSAWRDDPDFVLNRPAWRAGSILVVGPDFGTGSSREHAVWALQNYGFRVVIGSRFGDIFRGNSGKAGLLLATVPQGVVEELWAFCEAEPGRSITVDLLTRTIEAGGRTLPYAALFSHAQDTLMTTYSELRLARRLLPIFRTLDDRIRALEAKNHD